jgi:hypothetical protein
MAITPSCFRNLMDGNLSAGQREMLRLVDEAGIHPDAPLYRAVIQCSDPEATAWAWSAGVELSLPVNEIVRDDEYGGDGGEIRLALEMRAFDLAENLGSTCPDHRGVDPDYDAPIFACHQSKVGEAFACAGWLAQVGHRHSKVPTSGQRRVARRTWRVTTSIL